MAEINTAKQKAYIFIYKKIFLQCN